MINLFGEKLTKAQLFDRVGNLSQIAGVKRYELSEGREAGVGAIEVRTGGGLEYTVLPGRALDIAWASFDGIPMSFISKSGVCDSRYFIAERNPWGGSFYGGLMTTCGLTCVGVGGDYRGRFMPTHGDVANIPAAKVGAFEEWNGDSMTMGARGVVRQAMMYREELELTRSITSTLGENTITVRDEVENLGRDKLPLMILYHINFGYPMIGEAARAVINAAKTTAAPGAPEEGCKLYDKYFAPGKDYEDRCVHHDIIPDADGKARAAIVNDKLGVKATVAFDKSQLKTLCHWTHLQRGDYVTALEPANNFGHGTAGEEKNGTLEYIEPNEKRVFEINIEFERI